MTLPCIEPKDLSEILALPADDQRRRHLETCLHCRAMALAYEEFMDPGPALPDHDIETADAVLARRLAAIIERPQPVRRRPRDQYAWLAAAAVLLVCAGIFLARDAILLRDTRLPQGVGVVRGGAADPTRLAWEHGDDGWRLTWRTDTPGTPRIVFLDANLAELAQRPLAAPGSVRAAEVAAPTETAYLQLVFVAEGDVVARSSVVAARPDGP